ncbi:hypothetical protein PUN28_002018 [Cardiocondyla obscurior]|uniref:Uncharacterized protein n=1 Tax=Cardiocondyla obscurior TaxID=286306 RepID=A0AAW2GSB4_9HYME
MFLFDTYRWSIDLNETDAHTRSAEVGGSRVECSDLRLRRRFSAFEVHPRSVCRPRRDGNSCPSKLRQNFVFVAARRDVNSCPSCKLLSTTCTYAIRERLQLRWVLCNSPSTETPLTSDFVRVAPCLSL